MANEQNELPAAVDLLTAAKMLGIGRTMAYRLVRTAVPHYAGRNQGEILTS